jgi:hypothetical protein
MGWMVNAMPWLLYLEARDPVPLVQKAAWSSTPVWTGAENLITNSNKRKINLASKDSDEDT